MKKLKEEIDKLKKIAIDLISEEDHLNAIEYHKRIIELSKILNDKFTEAIFLNNLAIANKKIGNLNEALDIYKNMIKISEGLKNKKNELLTIAYCGAGEILSIMRAFNEAYNYYNKALERSNNVKGFRLKARTYNNIGLLYVDTGEIEKGIVWLKDAYKFLEDNNLTDTPIGRVIKENIDKAETFINSP